MSTVLLRTKRKCHRIVEWDIHRGYEIAIAIPSRNFVGLGVLPPKEEDLPPPKNMWEERRFRFRGELDDLFGTSFRVFEEV